MIKSCSNIKSDYLVCAVIKDSSAMKRDLVDPLVKRFFDSHDIFEYEELAIEHGFSDVDFPNIGFDQIYNNLLAGINKKSGEIKIPTKYLLTIDKINCAQKCKKTELYYDTIEINDHPFLFFIYIDLSLIISTLRSHKT